MSKTNSEIESSHTRLDEVKRGMPEDQDWATTETEIGECDTEIARLKGLREDAAKQSEEQGKARVKIQDEINDETDKLEFRKHTLRTSAKAEYYKKSGEKADLTAELERLRKQRDESRSILDQQTSKHNDLTLKLSQLGDKYRRIHASTFTFDETSQVCPTCKRHLPADDIENQRKILSDNFNTDKARMLSENVSEGNKVKEDMAEPRKLIDLHDAKLQKLGKEISEIESNPLLSQELEEPSDPDFISDAECKSIQTKIDELRKRLSEEPESVSITSYAFEEQVQTAKKQELQKKLYVRDTIDAARKRITEIETSIKTNGQYLLDLERDANTIKEIQKAKALSVEARINSMFSLVRFKMVADQINGGDRQVCETTVGGVPYGSLNNAARINAGLDIIRAFSQHFGVTAPVFVDNAEAVNELLQMQSQVISLVVTTDKQLTMM